jgi:Predicted membrane protein (DUF2306)
MATRSVSASGRPSALPKYLFFALYGALLIVVWMTRDRLLLDANSFLRQRYAPIPFLMILHGVPGTIALFLGIFQFSSRLRQRYIQAHRIMGWIYVVSTAIAAPVAVVVAMRLPIPSLLPASIIQASAWLLATGTAIYCVLNDKIQQHREWMMRGYPFAMVFVFARAIFAIPSIQVQGINGLIPVVWSVIAVAGVLPSFVIEWQHLAANRRVERLRAAARPA